MKVGVVGLGLMGSAMVRRLISSAHDVAIYNRDSSKTKQFLGRAFVASSPKDVASMCNFVICVVTDFSAVKEMMFGENGISKSSNS